MCGFLLLPPVQIVYVRPAGVHSSEFGMQDTGLSLHPMLLPWPCSETILAACAYTRTARTLALLRRIDEEDRADQRWCWAPPNGKDLRQG